MLEARVAVQVETQGSDICFSDNYFLGEYQKKSQVRVSSLMSFNYGSLVM